MLSDSCVSLLALRRHNGIQTCEPPDEQRHTILDHRVFVRIRDGADTSAEIKGFNMLHFTYELVGDGGRRHKYPTGIAQQNCGRSGLSAMLG